MGAPLHAFVDESKAKDYIVAAVMLPTRDLERARRAMRSLLLPRQHKLHLVDERPARKRVILDAVLGLGVSAFICTAPSRVHQLTARSQCLHRMTAAVSERDVREIVLELDESLLRHDTRIMFHAVRALPYGGTTPHYQWRKAADDPLLWAADAVAWSWAAGGAWRSRIGSVVTHDRV